MRVRALYVRPFGIKEGISFDEVKSALIRLVLARLRGFRQVAHLIAILFVARRDTQRQQMAQCIHRDMHLGTLAFLRAVESCTHARFGRGLKGARIQNHATGLVVSPRTHTHHQAQGH
jgi:hypothetical protein